MSFETQFAAEFSIPFTGRKKNPKKPQKNYQELDTTVKNMRKTHHCRMRTVHYINNSPIIHFKIIFIGI